MPRETSGLRAPLLRPHHHQGLPHASHPVGDGPSSTSHLLLKMRNCKLPSRTPSCPKTTTATNRNERREKNRDEEKRRRREDTRGNPGDKVTGVNPTTANYVSCEPCCTKHARTSMWRNMRKPAIFGTLIAALLSRKVAGMSWVSTPSTWPTAQRSPKDSLAPSTSACSSDSALESATDCCRRAQGF